MQKSVSGKADGATQVYLLDVPAGSTITDVCIAVTNNDDLVTSIEFYLVRSVTDDGTTTEQETKLETVSLNEDDVKNVPLEGAVFQSGDKLRMDLDSTTLADIDVDYLVSYTATVEAQQPFPMLELLVRKILEGLSGKQVCFLDTPLPLGPTNVPVTPSGGAVNANAKTLTAAVNVTDPAAWTDVLSVPITPSAADKDIRIWVTLLWEGWIKYRIVRGTSAITAELSVGDRESDTGVEPVVFPFSNSPATDTEQTYKLQAKLVTGTSEVSIGTTLYVEEIPG